MATKKEQYEKNYAILSRHLAEREAYIEELEARLAEYARREAQYDAVLEEKQNIEAYKNRIEELEQWTTHLQEEYDAKLGRLRQVKNGIRHPLASAGKLLRRKAAGKKNGSA